jgi:hypothetical protein
MCHLLLLPLGVNDHTIVEVRAKVVINKQKKILVLCLNICVEMMDVMG